MPINDAFLTMDNVTALTSSRVSTDSIDLSVQRDIGATEQPLQVDFRFLTLPTAAGAATVTVAVQTSTDNSTWVTQMQSNAVPIAQFTAANPTGGIRLRVPRTDRYIQLSYTIGTGPLTAGTIFAGLVMDRDLTTQPMTARF